MVARMPWRRSQDRIARDEYALSASTRAGRSRGRPRPLRGTQIASMTAVNCGASPRCPAVTTIDSGFWPCSHAKWILVENPPRERPSP